LIERLKGIFIPIFISLFLSVKDYFNKNYSYHSSALTYYLLLSIFPLLVFIFSVLSLFVFFNISYVYYILYNLFPSVSDQFLNIILNFYKRESSINISFLSILISLYFAKDLFIAIQMAFSAVWEIGYKGNKRNLVVAVISLPFLSLFLLVLYLLALVIKYVEEIKLFLEKLDLFFIKWFLFIINFISENVKVLLNLLNFSEILIFWFLVFLLFRFFTPIKVNKRKTLISSVLFTIFLILLKKVFEIILIKLLSKSPLFLTLGSVFVFLVWVKISFDIILIGQRFLYYYNKYPEGIDLPEKVVNRV
jgi:membrane protein